SVFRKALVVETSASGFGLVTKKTFLLRGAPAAPEARKLGGNKVAQLPATIPAALFGGVSLLEKQDANDDTEKYHDGAEKIRQQVREAIPNSPAREELRVADAWSS